MNEPTEEFYEELMRRIDECESEEEKARTFIEVHEKYDVDPEASNNASLDTWAVRIQCTPAAMQEELDSTNFLLTLNPQEMQTLILAQSEYGRHLMSLDEFHRVRELHNTVSKRLVQASESALPKLEALYARHHDAYVALADEAQAEFNRRAEEMTAELNQTGEEGDE